MSLAIAMIIFRMFSACSSSVVRKASWDSFVTPSTNRATSSPNSARPPHGHPRVLHHVVKKGGRYGCRVEPQIGTDAGRSHGMIYVGLAAGPLLALVLRSCDPESASDQSPIIVRVVLLDPGGEILQQRVKVSVVYGAGSSRRSGAAF